MPRGVGGRDGPASAEAVVVVILSYPPGVGTTPLYLYDWCTRQRNGRDKRGVEVRLHLRLSPTNWPLETSPLRQSVPPPIYQSTISHTLHTMLYSRWTAVATLLLSLPARAAFECVFESNSIPYDLNPLGSLRTTTKENQTPPTTSEAKVLLELCGAEGLPKEDGVADEDQVRPLCGDQALSRAHDSARATPESASK